MSKKQPVANVDIGVAAVMRMQAEIDRLIAELAKVKAIAAAQSDIIGYYEDEADRSQYEDDNVPEELREAELALEAAKG